MTRYSSKPLSVHSGFASIPITAFRVAYGPVNTTARTTVCHSRTLPPSILTTRSPITRRSGVAPIAHSNSANQAIENALGTIRAASDSVGTQVIPGTLLSKTTPDIAITAQAA